MSIKTDYALLEKAKVAVQRYERRKMSCLSVVHTRVGDYVWMYTSDHGLHKADLYWQTAPDKRPVHLERHCRPALQPLTAFLERWHRERGAALPEIMFVQE